MKNNTPLHILIAGPTASGKSGLALKLAAKHDALIVNADALQVYDCWQILTARPPAEDLATADHALYGHLEYSASYSVGAWLRDVAPLLASGRRLILVGGTGLYFQALTQGLAEIPPTPDAIRKEGDALLQCGGREVFQAYLATHDPQLYARMDTQNPARLQRAWEVHRATGRPLSAWQSETAPPLVPGEDCLKLSLVSDAEWLNARIDTRLDQMVANGALEECERLLPVWDPALPASRALGAPEFVSVLKEERSLAEALTAAKTATHQYAKRQRTWFRSKMSGWHQIPSMSLGETSGIDHIISMA